MILDRQNEFSSAQAVTGTAVSTNTIDLGSTGRTIGNIEHKTIVLAAVTAFAAAGAATLTAEIRTTENTDLSGSITLASFGPFSVADLDGSKLVAVMDLPDVEYRRYIYVRYVVATGPFTAGAITAAITADAHQYRSKARGYVIE